MGAGDGRKDARRRPVAGWREQPARGKARRRVGLVPVMVGLLPGLAQARLPRMALELAGPERVGPALLRLELVELVGLELVGRGKAAPKRAEM